MLESSEINIIEIIGEDWSNSSFIQLLHSGEAALRESLDAVEAQLGEDAVGRLIVSDAQPEAEGLSTIPEGTHED